MLRLQRENISGPLPTSTYRVELNGITIGRVQLRYRASKSDILPDGFTSHIYYEIDERYRGKGYGTQAFRLVLGEARQLGLSGVFLTISEDNFASRKVAEADGAVRVGEAVASDGRIFLRYVVNLSN